MIWKSLLVCCFICVIYVQGQSDQAYPRCPNNMIFSTCASCDRPCETRNLNFLCAAVCRVQCTCPRDMYVYKNTCYRASECPVDPPCPNNQVYSDCAGCDRTCEQRDQLIPCTLECRKKCTCPTGMYLYDGTCYNAEECPVDPPCPNNLVYSDCASCDKTCEQRDQHLVCTTDCRQKCTCPDGMFLQNGTCYTAEECPVG